MKKKKQGKKNSEVVFRKQDYINRKHDGIHLVYYVFSFNLNLSCQFTLLTSR